MLKLLLIRHAQSLGNCQGRMEGPTSTSLSEVGWQQARCLGQCLAAEGWVPSQIYCSPLLRAAQTLAGMGTAFDWAVPDVGTAASQMPVPITWDGDLQEYDNGVLAGLTWGEARQQYPQLCRRLESQLDWLPIPEGESLSAGRGRAAAFWQRLLRRHGTGDRIWVISHHWLLQQLLSVALGCDRTWGMAIGHTACFELWLDCDRWHQSGENRWNSELWQLRRCNDSQHLEG